MILLHSKRYGIMSTTVRTVEVSSAATSVGHHFAPPRFTVEVAATAHAARRRKGVIVVAIRHYLLAAKRWPIPSGMALRVPCMLLLWLLLLLLLRITTATAAVVPTRRWVLAVAVGIILRGIQTGGWRMVLLWWRRPVGVS